MKKILIFFAVLGALLFTQNASAQKVAVKTNLLYDATATINLGIEFRLAQRWTMDISGNYNGWTFSDNKKWKHWLVQPEARYWFCETFNGHFLGMHVLGGEFNVGNVDLDFKMLGTDFRQLKDHRFEGWMAGVGIAYGYSFILGKHWNLELEAGIGYIYTRYDKYQCAECGVKLANDKTHHYFGPTKLAVNLVYTF